MSNDPNIVQPRRGGGFLRALLFVAIVGGGVWAYTENFVGFGDLIKNGVEAVTEMINGDEVV